MGTPWKEIDLFPTYLQFSVFDSNEVKKLSVVKIVTGLTFDNLGRPLQGGLYDSTMGTYGRSRDPCLTCLSVSNCLGHFGHIELNALVYNPFFIKTIYEILRISCLHCKRIQISENLQEIITLQLKLIDAGYVVEAQDLDTLKSQFVTYESDKIKTESGDYIHPKIAEKQELLEKNTSKHNYDTKTTCAVRASIINATLQNSTSKKCIYCKNSLKRVRYSFKKLMTSMSKAELEALSDQNTTDTVSSGMSGNNKVILADECRQILTDIYINYQNFLPMIFPMLKNHKNPIDLFFMNVIPVIPPKSRPMNILNGNILEHPQTSVYRNIIETNFVLRSVLGNIKKSDAITEESMIIYKNAKGTTSYEKMYYAWQELQTTVDQLLDVDMSKDKIASLGLKQILEKKEGLIRKHMMGKRVNYAARTVITPDPNIDVDEVGIPDIFARKLSYPVPVTSWNISDLRKMVLNGPNIHPGANYIEDEKGHKILIPSEDSAKRESLAKILFISPENGIKIVHRHLINGDVLLLNRQPTLHRPGIMAHKARILSGEKTFRLHYSNCKSYNADFDGDEMNAHLPQNEVARSEAYNLANVANQYLVPKDGTPLGGLIQDHVISGVKLSIRGRFFNKEDYQQLVYQGLSHFKGSIKLLRPTIIKPYKLWSGKQILSTIIMNLIPENKPPINLTSTAKVSAKSWQTHLENKWISGGTLLEGNEMTEAEVIIRGGELLVGVLDKQQYGATPYGLIHCMYEVYGGACSTQLLTSFTKLFTSFLQREGFTLGVQDILVTSKADEIRKTIIKECRDVGNHIVASALDLDDDSPAEIVIEKMEEEYVKNSKFRVVLDRKYKSALDKYTNDINQCCLPGGLISKFPANNLQLMVLSGAKGSIVNTMQISCLLGQIELEGKRPPIMISGKSLPSFATFETSPKSGGFIDGRFMTGIQPQDFFFHCMAGREGLIDTAVKTSRSGYLQRCLIKHLEGLNVNYDMTVRDSDNSIVQFMYGEDGMDIAKSKFFNWKSLKFLDENENAILYKNEIIENNEESVKIQKHLKKLRSWRKKHGSSKLKERFSIFQKFSMEIRDEIEIENPYKLNKNNGRLNIDEKIISLWYKVDAEKKKSYLKKHANCPDPVTSKFTPNRNYGAISEYLENLIQSYSKIQPNRKEQIRNILQLKAIKSMASPGEPVGLLAAQSIGEPSTQMTLNTFHFAGRGEMNVTLGIPRLREILMLASSNIKTPSMDIPFKSNQARNIEPLRIKLNRVLLSDVIEYTVIKIRLILRPERSYQYTVDMKFLPHDAYKDEYRVTPKMIIKYVSEVFFKSLFRAIGKFAKNKYAVIDIDDKKSKQKRKNDNFELEERDFTENDKTSNKTKTIDIDDLSDAELDDEDDATDIKLKNRQQDENEYDDPAVEEELDDANVDDNNEDEYILTDDENLLENEDDNDFLNIVMVNDQVNDYVYDKENYLWCKLTFNLSMKYKKLDISNILREVASKSVIYEVENIKRAITYTNKNEVMLKTEGINIVEMFKYNKFLDLNRLYSNDIHAVARTYGIEAAAKVIVKEIKNVFNVYGITVDPRHLLLIADYMTFDGTFQPLSRRGMANAASPCQQMSFESSLQFLKTATISRKHDDLNSPSGRLMVGLPIRNGTGSFSLLTKIDLPTLIS